MKTKKEINEIKLAFYSNEEIIKELREKYNKKYGGNCGNYGDWTTDELIEDALGYKDKQIKILKDLLNSKDQQMRELIEEKDKEIDMYVKALYDIDGALTVFGRVKQWKQDKLKELNK